MQAFPVCAPYNTLLKYKYKVKLLSGKTKKGKVFKFIQEIFMGKNDVLDSEKDLIRYLPENQAI